VTPEIIHGVTFYMRASSLSIVTSNLNMNFTVPLVSNKFRSMEKFWLEALSSRHPLRFLHVPHDFLFVLGTSWTRDLMGGYHGAWLHPYIISCIVSKLWLITGQIFASDREVPHFNALAWVIPCECRYR